MNFSFQLMNIDERVIVERDSVKDDIFNDSKPIIVTPVLTSTPREKKAKARSKKVLHETVARDQEILAK